MWCQQFWKILLLVCLYMNLSSHAYNQKSAVVSDVNEYMEFKKLIKTENNVLVLAINNQESSQKVLNVFKKAADNMRGKAILVLLNCNKSEKKKLCKRLKATLEKPYYIKHYRNGKYHKDYDRGIKLSAMVNFLKDPSGDLPWEEDPHAAGIVHLADGKALVKFLKKCVTTKKKALIMFYAPWCSYCKTMKPDFIGAASELKGEAYLAAIDVSKPEHSKIRQVYNITGFPTLLYFEKGQFRFPYNGDNKHKAIVEFIKDPTSEPKKVVLDGSWSEDSDVLHLTAETFDSMLYLIENALVVFYAPWCGHCKRIKPEYEQAATRIKNEKINGMLAAVDATKQFELATRFGIKGYPTLKYFYRGEFKYDVGHLRQEEQIVEFIKSPQKPPPPPPPETPWDEEKSEVRHLEPTTFRSTLWRMKHAVVMFYAPWCGHCKSTKPEFEKAAEQFPYELNIAFCAVDCTKHEELCMKYDVKAYPTFKYISYFNKVIEDYIGGRKASDFVSFIQNKMGDSYTPQRSKSSQESGFGVNVQIADDSNFQDIISTPQPTFVMFYAVWCTYCSTLKPPFSRLATTLKNDNVPVKAIAIEAADNSKAADFASIQTLPALKIYSSGKLLADYEGDRSMEDMLKFCKSYAKVKDEL